VITSPPGGERSIAIFVSVCLSVCLSARMEDKREDIRIACSVLLCTTVVHGDMHAYEQFLKLTVGLGLLWV